RASSTTAEKGHVARPEVVVWRADHRGLGHTGVAEQHGLDLACADPEAACLDQVDRLAADDAVHPGVIDDSDVASAIPVAIENLGRCVRPVEVAVEYRRALKL